MVCILHYSFNCSQHAKIVKLIMNALNISTRAYHFCMLISFEAIMQTDYWVYRLAGIFCFFGKFAANLRLIM